MGQHPKRRGRQQCQLGVFIHCRDVFSRKFRKKTTFPLIYELKKWKKAETTKKLYGKYHLLSQFRWILTKLLFETIREITGCVETDFVGNLGNTFGSRVD